MLTDAVSKLRFVDAKIIGFVFNGVVVSKSGYGYYKKNYKYSKYSTYYWYLEMIIVIDVHCHVLPKIDDGSKSVEMSIEWWNKVMLKALILWLLHLILHKSHRCWTFCEKKATLMILWWKQ